MATSTRKNLVKEATATTGTGTLTLTALTGWARFADAYTVGQVVPYAIENGTNKEVGLGTVGASNTLARTTVLATLVGGVYDDTSPTAITLAGESTIFSGPLAELFDASEITFTPTGSLSSTDVQAALAELDSEKQPLDAELTAIAGLTSAANKGIQFTGSGAAATFDLTTAGKALLDDADATAQRATLGLGGAATQNIGTSGANVPLLSGVNVWSGNQTIEIDGTVISSVAAYGSSVFPILRGQRARGTIASPTAIQTGDAIYYSQAVGYNGSGFVFNAGTIVCSATENWTSGANGTQWVISTIDVGASAGTNKATIKHGLFMANATGGDKGVGTINATAVYDDNVLLTCYVLEAELTGQVALTKWDGYTLDLELPEEPEQVEERPVTQKVMRRQRVREGDRVVERQVLVDEPVYDELLVVDESGKPVLHGGSPAVERVQRTERVVTRPAQPARTEVRTHEPARRFAARAAMMLDPRQYGDFWKTQGHLPSMPSPDEWEAAGHKLATGDLIQRLWETVEVQAAHIDQLLARIEALEGA